jgi:hypothetical protein
MTVAAIPSATLYGVDGRPVTVEVHIGNGLPAFNIVGLPDASCRESRDRVRAAIATSGFEWPMRRVTINLAPATFAIGKSTTSPDATRGCGRGAIGPRCGSSDSLVAGIRGGHDGGR